jgi:hypothetical protein
MMTTPKTQWFCVKFTGVWSVMKLHGLLYRGKTFGGKASSIFKVRVSEKIHLHSYDLQNLNPHLGEMVRKRYSNSFHEEWSLLGCYAVWLL